MFQGIWKPRKIPNPAYFEDLQPFKMTPFSALGLELWSMTSDIFFDNFMITDDRNTAERWADAGWGLKRSAESAAEVGCGRDLTGCGRGQVGCGRGQSDPLQPAPLLQPGLVSQMLGAAEERPWLWIVYVLTVALPLVLIFVFCCTGKVKHTHTLSLCPLCQT